MIVELNAPSSWVWLALSYHIASRLAYVLYVGVALRLQDREGFFTKRYGAEAGFRRFRRVAATVMNNDAFSFIVLCLASWNELVGPPRGWGVAVGLVLIALGGATKLWAALTLGWDAYYWRNFFTPPFRLAPKTRGPYRFLRAPMYTVGYLPLYGLAILVGSPIAFVAALFDQIAILAFYQAVEKPHFERLRSAAQLSDIDGVL